MARYRRPHFDRYLGRRPRRTDPQFPYSIGMLKRYDVFELFPLDGGAFFFTNEHIGGADRKTFLKALRSGKLLAPWRKRGEKGADLDWMACYDDDKPAQYKYQTLEQHVWLHRLYFLLPLAQEYLRTGQRKWADTWYAYFRNWTEDNPEPGDLPKDRMTGRRWAWRDMQVVWRLNVMTYSVAMFAGRGGGKVFTPDQWCEIYRVIESSVRRVCKETRRQIVRGGGKNHFLHKGTSLIYTGTLFPELEGADYWVDLGSRVIRWYTIRHVNKDGGSAEACASYHCFIARLCLDAYLLLRANKRTPVKDLQKSVADQYAYMAQTATPAWRTLQWGDSYSMDMKRELEIVGRLFPLKAQDRSRSVCFPASQVPLLRSRNTAVYVDGLAGGGAGHIHRGKPHVDVYHRGQRVLIDSGCVNYDRFREQTGYLRTRAAHNTVVVEPVEGDQLFGYDTTYELDGFAPTDNGGSVAFRYAYRGKGVKYSWRRTVALDGDRVEIEDRLSSGKPMRCTLHFHLSGCRVSRRHGGFTARGDGWSVSGACRNGSGRLLAPAVNRALAVDDENRRFHSPDVTSKQSGRNVIFKTVLHLARA